MAQVHLEKDSHENEFKKICLVSSAAFSAASCVWPWTAPIGAGLGLYASIDTENRGELEAEFAKAVNAALRRTRSNLTTVDSQKVIDELSSGIVRPDNLEDLISKTDTYRSQYCTALDKKRIVEMFDVYFNKEVCECKTLSNYYLLAAGTVTLEKIKGVSDALIKQDKKLTAIEKGVDEINSRTAKIFAVFNALLRECGFVLIAVAGCLLSALAYKIHVPFFYLQVIICYLLSSLFTFSILRAIDSKANSQKATVSKPLGKASQSFMLTIFRDFFRSLIIYTVLSIGVYLIITASQPSEQIEQQNEMIWRQIACVSIGCSLKVIFHSISKPPYFE